MWSFSDQKQTKIGRFELNIIHNKKYNCIQNGHRCYNSLPRITGRVRQECNKVIDMQLFNTQTTKGKLSCVHSKNNLLRRKTL